MSTIHNEVIDVEVVSSEIVILKQEPIILYDLVEAKGKEVQERIASLNIETIEATDDNLQLLKKTRAGLNKEFKELEDKRKMIKDLVMKPYNDFEDAYKKHIQVHFKDADALLKTKVYEIDDAILAKKIDNIKNYFENVNTFDFIGFGDVGLDIKKSVSDKKLEEQIREFLDKVESDLFTIDTLPNKDRVLAKYQIVKDLNKAISDVNIELQREEQIQKQRELEEEARRVREEQIRKREQEIKQQCEDMDVIPADETVAEPVVHDTDNKIYQTSFRVRATKVQIQSLKEFMNTQGIKYESIS